ncbi:MAG: pseudouridine synthase [Dyadobacter sp. 50-39]|uniref:pseudouridine synthase n=1 Tax=Dyadobacter sp. 50-39 TaxID=1895756 RepID=UPI00095C77A7|nr:pseudouridine synthase [Dyadobacter sp. 50-39]OJV18953.1 MAG: pseudouridine synthase [Dyadobacter sp. 50-39]
MRNRNNPKGSQGGGGSFKRAKPAVESRFSKPSIKKSSLKFSGSADNKGQKSRPSFDHEKPREDRGGFDKTGFGKPRFDKPDFKKYGAGSDRPFRREGDSAGFKKDFGKKDFRPNDRGSDLRGSDLRGGDLRGGDRKPFGDRPERSGSGSGDRNREFKPRFDRDNDEREFRPRPDRDSRDFKSRPERGNGDREFKPRFDRDNGGDRESKPRFDRDNGGEREFKPRFDRDNGGDREFKPRFDRDNGGDREFKPRSDRNNGGEREFKPRSDRDNGDFKPRGERSERSGQSRSERPARSFDRNEGSFKKKDDREDKPYRSRFQDDQEQDRSGLERRVGRYETAPRYNLDSYEHKKKPSARHKDKEETDEIRLNRYIANAGICSRREADDLISSGQISVNGKTITEMGYKVRATDVVKYGKKALNPEKMVYILINKPKDYITTTDDPEERKTVLDLIAGACSERVYPVGRLDRNTTGLLLLTNDGELAEKLTHPSSGIKKIYQAELDKPIATEDFEQLRAGVELEDGFIRPDEVGLVTPDAQVVGLEIHSGRNRIVRRMFEHLGYEVQKLDRTVFAGLNKKDLPRGKWRFLTEKEVIKLKFLL